MADEPETRPATEPQPGRHAGRPRGDERSAELPATIFVGVAIACAALQATLSHRVFLFWDDYYFLGEARGSDLTRDYLGAPLFTHFSPVTRMANWLVVDAIAGHPWIIAAVQIVMLTCVVLAATCLMTTLFGRTWSALLGSVLLGVSLTLVPIGNWWTAGANILPGMAAFLAAFAAFALVVRGRSRWWAVLCLLCAAFSVLDYETPILLPGFLGLWVLLFRRRLTTESLLALLRRTWWLWSALAVISGAAALNYRLNYYVPQPLPALDDLGRALLQSLVGNLLPTAFGVHAPGSQWVETAGLVLGWLVLVGLVGWLLVTRRGSWRGLLFAGAGWLLPTLALLLNRLGRYGSGVADDAIYFYLPTALVVIGVLEATLSPRRRPAAWVPPVTLLRLTVPTLVLVMVGAYTWSVEPTTRYRVPLGASGDFVAQARTTAEQTREAVGEFSVIDSLTHSAVMPEGYGRYSRDSNVLGISVPDLSFDDPDPPYYRFDDLGALQPAPVDWLDRAGDARAGGTGRFKILGPTDLSFSEDRGNCFTATQGTLVDWRFPVVEGSDLVVRVLVTVDGPSHMVLSVAPTSAGRFTYPYPIDPGDVDLSPEGSGTLEIVAGTSIGGVRLRQFTPGTRVCLRSVEVGEVQSVAGP
jgi:hypothetical protein